MKKAVFIIMGMWFLISSGFIISQEYILKYGKEVLLKTVPVDPRDLFMGDYVILNYDIAQIRGSKYNFPENTTVFVTLKTDKNNVASVSNISTLPPSSGLYLKGKTGKCNTTSMFFKNGRCINFGIESYYVKEKTGRQLENDLRDGAFVKVLIDKNGNAKVKGFQK